MVNHADPSQIAPAYDRWAKTYDSDPNPTREMAGAVLRQLAFEFSGRDLIEVGCGTGRNTEWLAARARTVVAMDFSEAMLQKAKDRVRSPSAKFLRHDVRSAWPVAEASADLVVIMLVLEHVEGLPPVFAQAARTLRAGGELFVCELHPMRQIHGGQAQFTDIETGGSELIAAYLHDVSDYVNTAVRVGLALFRLDEWRDPDTSRADILACYLRDSAGDRRRCLPRRERNLAFRYFGCRAKKRLRSRGPSGLFLCQ